MMIKLSKNVDREETYNEQLKRFENDLDKGIQAYNEGRYTSFSELKEEFKEWRKDFS